MAQSSSPSAPSNPGGTSQLLKIVAGLTAVISLGLAIRQVVVFTTDYRTRKQQVNTLIATSQIQAEGGDYAAAWGSLNQARKSDPENARVRIAREDLAQSWIDHSRTGGIIPSLTALADTLSPTLTQGLLQADSARKADLLAHLGWADFLRWREGQRSLNPPARYRESLTLDPANPYAHVMLGHWMLWQGEALDSVRAHFTAALAAGRVHDYVRDLQIAALSNRQSDAASIELIRVANEMRGKGEALGDARDSFWRAFNNLLGSYSHDEPPVTLTAAVPAADLLATYQWAFQGSGYQDAQAPQYRANLGQLQALSGDREAAERSYREVLGERNLSGTLRGRLTRALAALKAR